MKEIKAFLSNQKDIYTVMLLEEMKSESPNFVAMRDILNMVIANEITLQGIKRIKMSNKRFRRTPEEIEQGLTVEQAKAARNEPIKTQEELEAKHAENAPTGLEM